MQGLPFLAVAERIAALGVPEGEAEAFWAVAKGNVTILDDLGQWWTLFRDGAEPVVDEADRDFVRQALALLARKALDDGDLGRVDIGVVKDATGRKGEGPVPPAAPGT